MMKFLKTSLILFLLVLFCSVNSMAGEGTYNDTIEVFKKSESVQPFFQNAYGYAVFPTVGKGGIVLGGAYGNGRTYVDDRITGTATLVKVSLGFQLGGQAFSEIIFFEDKAAYEKFISGNFEFDGSLSAVVITAAAQAQTSTQGNTAGASLGPATGAQGEKLTYTNGMAVFIHTLGGLMYEMSIGGQKFSFEPI